MDEDTEVRIQLENFPFPRHGQVQDWLNNTDYGEQFDLIMSELRITDALVDLGAQYRRGKTVATLIPKTDQAKFYWQLKGQAGATQLEQKLLDYIKSRAYNV